MPVPVRGVVPAPDNVGAMQNGDAAGSLPISIEDLDFLLRNSSPADQRLVCLHTLYNYTYSKIKFGVVLAIC